MRDFNWCMIGPNRNKLNALMCAIEKLGETKVLDINGFSRVRACSQRCLDVFMGSISTRHTWRDVIAALTKNGNQDLPSDIYVIGYVPHNPNPLCQVFLGQTCSTLTYLGVIDKEVFARALVVKSDVLAKAHEAFLAYTGLYLSPKNGI